MGLFNKQWEPDDSDDDESASEGSFVNAGVLNSEGSSVVT